MKSFLIQIVSDIPTVAFLPINRVIHVNFHAILANITHSLWPQKHMKTKIVYQRCFIYLFFWKKKRNRAFAKKRRKKSVDKNKKTATAWTCIRPKMVTRNSSFFSCYVSLLLELGYIFLRSLRYHIDKRARRKKHQKCTKNSNDLKCFAGQVLYARETEMEQRLGSKIY